MADFFSNKDYSDYFEKLNSQMEQKNTSVPQKSTEEILHTKKTKKRGIYKTFRLRYNFLFVAIALILVLTLVIILSLRSCSIGKADVEKTVSTNKIESQISAVEEVKISYETDENTVELPKSNDAKAGVIIRKSDNKIIAQRNAHQKIYPASTLKIMTLLIAVENIKDMNDTFTMSLSITDPLYVAEASVAGFLNGEVITMTDLLHGLILPSGADAAMGLAIKVAGSEEAFVELMNNKVRELGLTGTHFTNCSGLYHKDNYSTAYDMAVITDYAMRNEICRKVLTTYQHKTQKTPQNPKGILLQSTLFSYMYGTEPETAVILGGKTGFVNEAGYCIASFGENIAKTEEYIVVTMGNSSKWPAFYGQIDLYKEFAK